MQNSPDIVRLATHTYRYHRRLSIQYNLGEAIDRECYYTPCPTSSLADQTARESTGNEESAPPSLPHHYCVYAKCIPSSVHDDHSLESMGWPSHFCLVSRYLWSTREPQSTIPNSHPRSCLAIANDTMHNDHSAIVASRLCMISSLLCHTICVIRYCSDRIGSTAGLYPRLITRLPRINCQTYAELPRCLLLFARPPKRKLSKIAEPPPLPTSGSYPISDWK